MVAKKTEKRESHRMAIAEKNIRVNVTLSRKENEMLKRVAKLDGRSVSNYLRFAALKDAESRDAK